MKYNLSVVVLVYNTAEYLHECIDSLLSQSLSDIEIILVDDDSTDDSLLICREYEEKHNNVKVIHQSNQGGAVAGNNGVKHATGEYVAIIDSDDIVPSNAYKILFEKAKINQADISMGKPMRLISGKLVEVPLDREKHVWRENRVLNSYSEFENIVSDCYYWNKIFKREFVEEFDIKMPPGILYADRVISHLAYLNARKIVITDEVVYHWRRREASAVSQSVTQSTRSINNFKQRLESFEHERELFSRDNKFSILVAEDSINRLLFNIGQITSDIEVREFYLTEVSNFFNKFEVSDFSNLTSVDKLLFYFVKEKMEFELGNYISRMWSMTPYLKNNKKLYSVLPYRNNRNIPDSVFENNILDIKNIRNSQLFVNNRNIEFQCLIRSYREDMDINISLVSNTHTISVKKEVLGDYYRAIIPLDLLLDNSNYYVVVSDGDSSSIYLRKSNFEPKMKNSLFSGVLIRFTASAKYVRVKKVKFSLGLLKKGLMRGLKKIKN